jgi:hypothetical protein
MELRFDVSVGIVTGLQLDEQGTWNKFPERR